MSEIYNTESFETYNVSGIPCANNIKVKVSGSSEPEYMVDFFPKEVRIIDKDKSLFSKRTKGLLEEFSSGKVSKELIEKLKRGSYDSCDCKELKCCKTPAR